jgi:hypothetical protein
MERLVMMILSMPMNQVNQPKRQKSPTVNFEYKMFSLKRLNFDKQNVLESWIKKSRTRSEIDLASQYNVYDQTNHATWAHHLTFIDSLSFYVDF